MQSELLFIFYYVPDILNSTKISISLLLFINYFASSIRKKRTVPDEHISELKSKGIHKIALDANEASIKIYEKIGFKLSNNHMVL
ncbi:MAG: hypothetical protein N2645_03945 [Clostridia bacterium]|nr:hypothetical protein [Clostridia bacterium]